MIQQSTKCRYNARGDDRHAKSLWVECRATRRPEEDHHTQKDRQALRCAKRGQEGRSQGFSQTVSREEGACRQGQARGEDTREEDQASC